MRAPPPELSSFYDVEYPRVVSGLTLIVGSREVAEELAQEAFVRAFQRWSRVSGLDSPGGWTWRVAVNLASSHLRRRRAAGRARRRLQNRPSRAEAPSHPDEFGVRTLVAALPHRQRVAVVSRYFLDMSISDTAALMEVSEDAVKALTKRATASLRASLATPPHRVERDSHV